jgi:hypothetical protein
MTVRKESNMFNSANEQTLKIKRMKLKEKILNLIIKYLLLITLNVNGLSSLFKVLRLAEFIVKQDPMDFLFCLQEPYFTGIHTETESKRIENDKPRN